MDANHHNLFPGQGQSLITHLITGHSWAGSPDGHKQDSLTRNIIMLFNLWRIKYLFAF